MREFSDYSELFLSVNATLDNLSFGIEATKFEAALKDVGALLGYVSQRPDKEIRKGPDNLWCGSNYYLNAKVRCPEPVRKSRNMRRDK